MNVHNNRKRKETLGRIRKAFLELILQKNLNQLSVTELCRKAGINRTTFYSCYDGMYDIADSIRHELENNAKEFFAEDSEGRINFNYMGLFRYIRDNQSLYRAYFKLGYDNQYRIIRYDKKTAEEHFGSNLLEYHMEFFRAGLTQIIKLWLENGCRESPERIFDVVANEYQRR